MEFAVLSRNEIKNFRTSKKHIVISVMDPKDSIGPAKLFRNEKRLGKLLLQFHDLNNRHREIIKKSESFKAGDFIFFDQEMAKEIVGFVRKFWSRGIELIVCQCDAGISRSAGIAAVLAKCINGNDKYFFKHFIPNTLVYSLILEEWNKG